MTQVKSSKNYLKVAGKEGLACRWVMECRRRAPFSFLNSVYSALKVYQTKGGELTVSLGLDLSEGNGKWDYAH